MKCIVKGRKVGLHMAKYKNRPVDLDRYPSTVGYEPDTIFFLDPNYLLLHCVDESVARVCDVYIARPRRVTTSTKGLSEETIEAGQDYYGSGFRPKYADLVLPNARWQRLFDVDHILYDRPGDLKGSYEHPYMHPVMLFRSGSVYRLALPDGCILNAHGFVVP
jgi:hypothetical protein